MADQSTEQAGADTSVFDIASESNVTATPASAAPAVAAGGPVQAEITRKLLR
jgi:hypothetical protein